jgi:hypothetical protein
MAKNDCPLCEGKKRFLIANTNIQTNCEFCDDRGEVMRPKNFDDAKIEPGLITRITNFFNGESNA